MGAERAPHRVAASALSGVSSRRLGAFQRDFILPAVPPDPSDWRVVSVYRGFLYSAALVATGIQNYLEKSRIDSAVVFNGRQSITRVALELFRHRGIRVLTHERAEYERGHLSVKPNAHCMSLAPFQAFWSMWAQVPLTRSSLEAALKWLIQRRYGANLAWIPFNTSWVRDSSLRARLNLSRDKHLLALFTSSMDEVAGDRERQGPYDSQVTWVRDVVNWVGNRTGRGDGNQSASQPGWE